MKCEICDKNLVKEGDLREDGSEKCPDGHYYYNHSYGLHEEHIDATGDGMVVMSTGWHYTEPEETTKKRDAARKAFIEYAKEFSK